MVKGAQSSVLHLNAIIFVFNIVFVRVLAFMLFGVVFVVVFVRVRFADDVEETLAHEIGNRKTVSTGGAVFTA